MKDVSKEELAKAIREARAGRAILSPEAATDLLAQGPFPRNVTTWQREPFADCADRFGLALLRSVEELIDLKRFMLSLDRMGAPAQ